MRHVRLVAIAAIAVAATLGAGSAAAAPTTSWEQWVHLPGAVDVAGPRSDGRLVVAARGRLVLLSPSGVVQPFAPAYAVPDTGEPYIALALGQRVEHTTCSFERDEVLALDVSSPRPGITAIRPNGTVSHLATIDGVSALTGIAIDTVGSFGHRVLVTGTVDPDKTGVLAVDCLGVVTEIATVPTQLEGGATVAPLGLGPFGGDLIAPNERDGSVYAISHDGRLRTVVRSDVPAGGDIGVENLGFVPPTGAVGAYVADHGGQGGAHSGDDAVLRLPAGSLTRAGVRPGDLFVGVEGAATAIDVRCAEICVPRVIATGPPLAHAEGHVVFIPKAAGAGSRRGVVVGAIAAVAAVVVIALVALALARRRRGRP
jgi:hypothetical protein